jgi:hypothetical protein
VVPLVKAVQEQQVLIEKLTRQVEQTAIPAIVGKQQLIIEEQNKKLKAMQADIEMLKAALSKKQ